MQKCFFFAREEKFIEFSLTLHDSVLNPAKLFCYVVLL